MLQASVLPSPCPSSPSLLASLVPSFPVQPLSAVSVPLSVPPSVSFLVRVLSLRILSVSFCFLAVAFSLLQLLPAGAVAAPFLALL